MKTYKKILGLMIIMSCIGAFAGDKVGNGGGGIKVNGVYKTFYSAGVYINPTPEKSIPGQKLYTDTILNLSGAERSKSILISSALPVGERKFYKILPEKMDTEIMDRLLEEYTRIIKQRSKDDLTIFAITDIKEKVTYLLPSFYDLSEIEQAAIIFHEAYWIMKPSADYAEVVAAEQSFQKFLEFSAAGKFDLDLPRLIGELLQDPTIPLRSAFIADARLQTVPKIIKKDETINARDLILNDESTCRKSGFIPANSIRKIYNSYCAISTNQLENVIRFANKYPNSYFFEQLVNFLTDSDKAYRFVSVENRNSGFGKFDLSDMDFKITLKMMKYDTDEQGGRREYVTITIN